MRSFSRAAHTNSISAHSHRLLICSLPSLKKVGECPIEFSRLLQVGEMAAPVDHGQLGSGDTRRVVLTPLERSYLIFTAPDEERGDTNH